MVKLKSSIPGMKYPAGRDYFLRTMFGFLEGRRKDDGAENLWRIDDDLYDLEDFIKNHPGGREWLVLTKGTDITEAFQAHHITDKAEDILPKYFARKATSPRAIPYQSKANGFHEKFKVRAREALKDVDYLNPSARSKFIADLTVIATILSVIAVASYKSWLAIGTSGLLLCWTVAIAHNFCHMKDNFRLYYLDLCLMSSKEFRISHVLSHHLYPNTLWDLEVYALEPFITYLTCPTRLSYRLLLLILHMPLYPVLFFGIGFKRYYALFVEWKKFEFRDIIPFFLPLLMLFFASSAYEAVKLWMCVIGTSSFFFCLTSLNGAHHHPQTFHDGDIVRQDLDWALVTLDAVRDRKLIDDSLFLTLTNFGCHAMHHMLPTVDHDYLPLCLPAFHETCREFGVDVDSITVWQSIKGNYQQILRTQPKANYRGGPDGGAMRT